MSERPVQARPRRLADWINPTEAKKNHSLIDKVYKKENLSMAWERVRGNGGSGGVDKQSVTEFEAQCDQQLDRLQEELRGDCYQPQPVRQAQFRRRGSRAKFVCWACQRCTTAYVNKRYCNG
jgi:RNA-directed DNA polymerase